MDDTTLRILGALGAAGAGGLGGYALGHGDEIDDPRATEAQKNKARMRGALLGMLSAAPIGYFAPEAGRFTGLLPEAAAATSGESGKKGDPGKADTPGALRRAIDFLKVAPGRAVMPAIELYKHLSLPFAGDNKDSIMNGLLTSAALHGGWQAHQRLRAASTSTAQALARRHLPGSSDMRSPSGLWRGIDIAANPALGQSPSSAWRRGGRAAGLSTLLAPVLMDAFYNSNAK